MSYIVKEAAATVLLENAGRTLLYKGETVPASADKDDVARLVKEGYLTEAPETATSDGEGMAEGSDPGDFTVKEVQAYLAGASEEEKTRVLAAEADGKNRPSLVKASS